MVHFVRGIPSIWYSLQKKKNSVLMLTHNSARRLLLAGAGLPSKNNEDGKMATMALLNCKNTSPSSTAELKGYSN